MNYAILNYNMIDRYIIECLYHDWKHEEEISCFYQLLCDYAASQETKKIEECLKDLNLLCCRHKIRPVYYDNHCLKTDLDRYILETWRQESINIHREAGKDKGKR